MTRVTFLHGAGHRLQAVAGWIARRYTDSPGPILIYIPDSEQGKHLDRLLWTQHATGFLPHCRATDELAGETPIVIAENLDQPPHDACLLNLSNEVPPGFSRFEELVEIISTEDEDKLPGRERFRFYRERGYPLENRDISGGL